MEEQHRIEWRTKSKRETRWKHLSLEDHGSRYNLIGACFHLIGFFAGVCGSFHGLLTNKALTWRSLLPWRCRRSKEVRDSANSLGRWRLKTKLAYPREEVDKSDKLAQKFGSNFTLWLILILHEVGSSFYSNGGPVKWNVNAREIALEYPPNASWHMEHMKHI